MKEEEIKRIPELSEVMSVQEIADHFERSVWTIYRHIKNLKKAGHKVRLSKRGRKKINYEV